MFLISELILEIDSEFNSIFNEFEQYLSEQVSNEEDLQKIILSTIELVNNALEHGNKADTSKLVYLAYFASDTEIKITVRDEGKGFDPASLDDPREDGKNTRERGRGIFIIKSYMDELHYNEEGNTLTAIKSLHKK